MPGSYVTGVGKHVVNMTKGLVRKEGCEAQYLAANAPHATRSPLAQIPHSFIHFPSRRTLEACWSGLNWPPIERWVGECEWVYCTKEAYVPTAGARLAVTVHDLYAFEPAFDNERKPAGRYAQMKLAKILERADLIAAVSQFTKSRLEKLWGVDGSRIAVIGNGVEDGFFDVARLERCAVRLEMGLGDYVLSVGGITHKKGADALLALARTLRSALPDIRLVVTGPVEPSYQALVDQESQIVPLKRGFCDAQMHKLVRGALATVYLSRYEGFGIPVLEAMAACVPVIIGRQEALLETAAGHATIVDPMRSADIVECIRTLRSGSPEPDLRAAQLHARGQTWDRCVDRLCNAMRSTEQNLGIRSSMRAS